LSATRARQAALHVLSHVRSGGLADPALRSALNGLPKRERAWTVELVRGTLRLRGRLDYIIAHFCNRPLDRLDADVLDVLRLGAYQLLVMDGVPAYAAVSQSVDLVRTPGAGRLVNAVLRSIMRADGTVAFPDFAVDPVGWLTSWGSHPRWLVERWVARFGIQATRRLVESNNQRPVLYLHTVGESPAPMGERLAAAGIDAQPVSGIPGSVRVDSGAAIEAALAAAPVIVQDPAATLVAGFADPGGGLLVDLCAAPGGKAIALAAVGGTTHASGLQVVAADLSSARIGRLVENVNRLALPVSVVIADGRRPPFRPVDAVLIDAPCTGTGTLRRHADARWRIGPSDLAALVALQAALLESAATIVRPGGLLVYATCSIEDEENDEQVEAFLGRHNDFDVEPPGTAPPCNPDGLGITEDGRLRLLPQEHGFDGAFAVRMRRRR
jgi:16S rRNA (cytosine967-C5)-methyltransferase